MFNIICALLGHHRSKRHRKPARGIWTSQCSLCRTRLERIGPGQWRPVADHASRGSALNPNRAATAD